MTPMTVEQLQEALQMIGKNPAGVQWESELRQTPQDGAYVLRHEADGVRLAMVSRDREIGVEYYADEATAVAVLHRRLVASEPNGTPEGPDQRAAVIARMQAKAAAEQARRRGSSDR